MNNQDVPLIGARVLVVEDDPIMLRVIEGIISPRVGRVFLASDGREGLALWHAEHPDVIVTDIAMPTMDGLAMSAEIRALDHHAEIIILSASNEIQDIVRAMEIGVDRYVLKPVDAKLLLDAIRKCTQSRAHSLELDRARKVFEVASEGIVITDEQKIVLSVNPAFSKITGYQPDEIIGKHTSVLSSGLHDPAFYREMWSAISSEGQWAGEVTNRRRDGGLYAQELSIAAVESGQGNSNQYVGVVSDISQRKKEEELIRHLAYYDGLTGLASRFLFDDRLQRELAGAKRHRHSIAVLFIDLDRLKEVNEVHGNVGGDAVLKEIAERLCVCIRQTDLVSRWDADQFAIVLDTVTSPQMASRVCARILEEIAQPITIGGHSVAISASIGIAMAPDDAEDVESLLNAADFALYEAQRAGGNGYSFFSQEAMQTVHSRRGMERELRAGMADWRYSLQYLPEVCLRTGKVSNVEALLRFNHSEYGFLDAGRFLEFAEEIGIMPELGHRALVHATQEIASLSNQHLAIGLVVNLSVRQLAEPDAAPRLLALLAAEGVPYEQVTFESAERCLHNETAMKTLHALVAAGCKFTLDDFGDGACSFSLISTLPMNSIKIDRSFISQLQYSDQYRQLVAALVVFSQRLGLKSIAEGVETEAQLNFLKEIGCDYAQGFFFGEPMDFETLRKYLSP